MVLSDPLRAPFRGFGDTSYDFELLCWIAKRKAERKGPPSIEYRGGQGIRQVRDKLGHATERIISLSRP